MPTVRLLLPIFFLGLACVFAGCSDPQKDAENKKKVEALLDRLPQGWKADIEVRGDTLAIRNFTAKWSVAEGDQVVFDLSIDELTAEDVDFDTLGAPGKPPLGKLTLKKARALVVSHIADRFSFSQSFDLLEVNRPEGDFAGLLAVIDGKAKPETLLDTLHAWKVGPVKVENEVQDVSYTLVGYTTTTGRWSLQSASLLRWEGVELANVSVRVAGIEFFSLEAGGCGLVQLPDFLPLLKADGGLGLSDPDDETRDEGAREVRREKESLMLLDALRAQPLRVEGIFYRNMRIRPMTTDPITVGHVAGDVFLSPEMFRFDTKVTGLDVPASVLVSAVPLRDIGLNMGESLRGEGALHYEGRAGEKGGTGAFSTNLKVFDRGALDLAADSSWPTNPDFPVFPAGEQDLLARGFSIGLEDLGGIDKVLAARGGSRADLIARLMQDGPAPGLAGEVQKAFLALVEKSGKVRLTVAFDPPEPWPALQEKSKDMPATWKVVLEHTPPSTKK